MEIQGKHFLETVKGRSFKISSEELAARKGKGGEELLGKGARWYQ